MNNKTNIKEFKVELTEKQSTEILKETLKKSEIRGADMYLLRKAIENILADRERVLEEKKELTRENFKLKTELENKQKEYQDTYKDVREELKELQAKANKYDALVEKIKETVEDLANMKVDGEVFTTAVNFARNQIQELIDTEEE